VRSARGTIGTQFASRKPAAAAAAAGTGWRGRTEGKGREASDAREALLCALRKMHMQANVN
jgi:hypothetical protein